MLARARLITLTTDRTTAGEAAISIFVVTLRMELMVSYGYQR